MCTETHYQQTLVLSSTLCLLMKVYQFNWSLENTSAIMSAQMRTAVLIKEAIKLPLIRLINRNKEHSSETCHLF